MVNAKGLEPLCHFRRQKGVWHGPDITRPRQPHHDSLHLRRIPPAGLEQGDLETGSHENQHRANKEHGMKAFESAWTAGLVGIDSRRGGDSGTSNQASYMPRVSQREPIAFHCPDSSDEYHSWEPGSATVAKASHLLVAGGCTILHTELAARHGIGFGAPRRYALDYSRCHLIGISIAVPLSGTEIGL
jgi:hypothetical protein